MSFRYRPYNWSGRAQARSSEKKKRKAIPHEDDIIPDDEAEEIIDMIVDENTEVDWERAMYLAIHRPKDFGKGSEWMAKPDWYLQFREGNQIGPRGWYGSLFHFIVVRQPPLDVVKQILEAGVYPETFLFNMVSSGSEFRFPDTSSGISMKKCLLQLAIESGASLDVVDYLVYKAGQCDCEKLEKAVIRLSAYSHLPLPILRVILKRYPSCATAKKPVGIHNHAQSLLSLVLSITNPTPPDLIERLDLLLMATAVGTIDSSEAKEKNFLRPHSLIRQLLSFGNGRLSGHEIQELHFYLNSYRVFCRDEFTTQDNEGDLPLHILVANSDRFPRASDESSGFRSFLAEHTTEYPESTKVRNNAGRTPLEIAASVASPFYDIILEKSIDVLSTSCPRTHLFPFQVAACSDAVDGQARSASNSKLRTEICFQLLRKAPDVIDPRRLGLEDPWLENKIVREIHADELKLEQFKVQLLRKKQKLEALKKSSADS